MYNDGRVKMFMKKMENVLNRQGAMEFFLRLDVIRNLSASNNGESIRDMKFALDEKIKINMYLNKLMPSAYKDSSELYRQSFKNIRLENITEENNQNVKNKNITNITNTNSITNTIKAPKEGTTNTLTLPPASKLTSISKQPNITINKVKESKFYKLSTINSKYNNFIQGESEVPFFPAEIKNTISSVKQRGGTVLSNENINKKEMFNPTTQMMNKNYIGKATNDRIISIIPSSNGNLNITNIPDKNTLIPPQGQYPGIDLMRNKLNNVYHNFSLSQTNNNDIKNMKNQITKNKMSIKYSNLVRIGDVVLMRYNYKSKDNSETNEGILYPEKVISKQIFCIPMNKIEELGGGKSIFKRSLFRIENPQSCIFQYQYENAKKMLKDKKNDKLLTKEEESVKELCLLANEEKKGNESEFQLNYNNEVAYGQMIQFRNVFTNELLVVDMANISKEIGCLDVVLNPLGGQTAWFKLIPSHKIRNQGECISYLDDFYILPTGLETESFMHVNHNDEINNSGMEINISSRKSIFKLSLFESAEDIKKAKAKNVIKSTSVIKLYNQDYEGYLRATYKTGTSLLQKLITDKKFQIDNKDNYNNTSQNEDYSYNEHQEDNEEVLIVNNNTNVNNSTTNIKNNTTTINNQNQTEINNHSYEEADIDYIDNEEGFASLAVKRASYYSVSLNVKATANQDCNSYWEIQYEKPYEGKVISFGCPIRLRHIPSGFYLSFNADSNEIGLTQSLDEQSVFYIYSDSMDNNMNESVILNHSQVYFFARNTDSYLKVNDQKCNDDQYGMILSKEDKMEYAKMIFKVEMQNDSLVKINYNIALTIHHLRNLYDEINYWGIRIIEGDEIKKGYVYDYFVALDGEGKFAEMINVYKNILNNLKELSIINKPESIHFKQFQNFHTDQGIISILLKFIMLLDSKSLIINSRQNEEKGLLNEGKERASPEKIAKKYTPSAISLTFEVIMILINDNSHSSQSIYSSINMISKLFMYHKLEIIQILIICLQNTNKKNTDSLLIMNNNNDNIPHSNKDNGSSFQDDKTKNTFHNFYSQIGFWKTKIAELDEKVNNLQEQKLFIQIMQMLCLDSDGEGIFVNQMEIKVKMYENDIFPLKFGMDDNNRPYVIFTTKLTYDEFFAHNPSLSEIKKEKNNFKDVPIFYYDSFTSRFQNYIDYISSVLDLYYASCVSRNQINIHIISNSKHVGLTIAHIWQVINDTNISMNIRIRYLKLFRVLYIDSEPYLRISKFRLRVFMWNNKPKDNEDLIEYIYKWYQNTNSNKINTSSINEDMNMGAIEREKFDFLRIYIRNFFKKINNIEHIVNLTTFDELTHSKEVFKSVLDYNYNFR